MQKSLPGYFLLVILGLLWMGPQNPVQGQESPQLPAAIQRAWLGYFNPPQYQPALQFYRDSTLANSGAELNAIDEALRAQLKLPEGQGLVVRSLDAAGRLAKAGVQVHDVLLAAQGSPLATTDDLEKRIQESAGETLIVTLIRAGEKQDVSLDTAQPSTDYQIGVSASAADETLRAQLNLPADRGVIVTGVVDGSPAIKAGLAPHDVILLINGNPVDTPETLASQVDASNGQELALVLVRRGQQLSIKVQPIAVDTSTTNRYEEAYIEGAYLNLVPHVVRVDRQWSGEITAAQAATTWNQKLDELLQRVQDLQKAVTELQNRLPVQPK